MNLIKTRIVKVDLSGVETQLKRLNNNLEEIFHINRPDIVPDRDFDVDDYSDVMYTDEEQELINERVGSVIIGK